MKKLILTAVGFGLAGMAAQAGVVFGGSIGFGCPGCRGGWPAGCGVGVCPPVVVQVAPVYPALPPAVCVRPAPVYVCPPYYGTGYRYYGDWHHHGHGW